MKVILTESAELDLESIGDWIARDSRERAIAFLSELKTACKAIGKTPHGFPLVDRQRDPTLRRRVYGNYLIFYEIHAGTVAILHVLHGARDYVAILFANDDSE